MDGWLFHNGGGVSTLVAHYPINQLNVCDSELKSLKGSRKVSLIDYSSHIGEKINLSADDRKPYSNSPPYSIMTAEAISSSKPHHTKTARAGQQMMTHFPQRWRRGRKE